MGLRSQLFYLQQFEPIIISSARSQSDYSRFFSNRDIGGKSSGVIYLISESTLTYEYCFFINNEELWKMGIVLQVPRLYFPMPLYAQASDRWNRT